MATSPRTELRMVAAYALTPFVAFALAYLAEMTLWARARTVASVTTLPNGTIRMMGAGGSAPPDIALALAMSAALAAVFVTVFGAVPLVAWRLRRGGVSLRQTLVAGAALGNAPVAILLLLVFIHHLTGGTVRENQGDLLSGVAGAARTITLGSVVGMGCAAVFWALAIRGTEADKGPRGTDA